MMLERKNALKKIVLVVPMLLLVVGMCHAQVADVGKLDVRDMAGPALQDTPSMESKWTWKYEVIKTADTLKSLGIGAGLRVIVFADDANLWFDAAPYYDDATEKLSGIIGLSTEADGIPVVRNVSKVFERALGAGCSTVGFGALLYDDDGLEMRGVAYATWQF